MNLDSTFSLPLANEIQDIIKSLLDPTKATGIDTIPPGLVKSSASVTYKPLTKIINKSILKDNFPDLMQIGKITPIYKSEKTNSRLNKKDPRPVILPAFSKVPE